MTANSIEGAEMLNPVGRSIERIDGRAKVTGAAQYVDDLVLPNMGFGATLRSRVSHGRFLGMRRAPSFDWHDITLVTTADIPGDNTILLIERDQPVLVPVGGVIKHADESLALVAAPSRERLALALANLQVDEEPWPAALDIASAEAARVSVYSDDNIIKRLSVIKGGDIDAALAQADLIIDGTYHTGAQEQMYIEPQGMLAWWNHDDVHVTGSMQCPYYVHAALKTVLALDDDHIHIAQATTGGGFGGKEEYPSMLAAHAALLARKAGRPVKMIYSRSEDIAATTKRHPAWVHHRLGVRRDGTLVAADIDVVIDGGAYVTLTPVVLSRAVLHAAGPYRIANVRIRGRAFATNTPPHGAFRGFGAPQVTFAYERQMDKAAKALGLDPFELRRRNMLRLGDSTATGQVLRYSVASDKVLDAVERPAPTAATHAAQLRGRGLAFYYHGAGFTGRGEERLKGQVAVALTASGQFEVRSASTDIGQGATTIFTQLAAAALHLPIERVRVVQPETRRVPNSGPTVASRTCMIVGAVVEQAAAALYQRLERFAAETGLPIADITTVAQRYATAHGEIEERATYTSPPGINFDEEHYKGDAYPVFGWAACVAEVSVDPDTYEVSVERLIHAVDVGKAVHPVIVKGQIEGGTLQALGWALWENVVYKDGRVLNRRMTDCIIPTAMEAPEMETIIVEEPYPHGPHGAKGVGEIPMDGPGAAIANAVAAALDVAADTLPLLPETLHALVQRGGS